MMPTLDPIKHEEDTAFYSRACVLAVKAGHALTNTGHGIATASRRTWTLLNVLLIGFAAFAVFSLLWMLFDRKIPTTFDTVAIVNPIVPAGGELKVHFVVITDRSCEVATSYDIIDGDREIHHIEGAHQDAMRRTGVADDVIKPFLVPRKSAPGHAFLRLKWSYECPVNLVHPIYPITLVWPDLPFEIVPPS